MTEPTTSSDHAFGVTITRDELESLVALLDTGEANMACTSWLVAVRRQVELASSPTQQYCCQDCGSRDIKATAWIDLNTSRVVDDDPPCDDTWREAREAHTDFVTVADFNAEANDHG